MSSDQTYKRLCDRLRTGDTTCIEELYDMYGDALYGVIVRIVKSEEVASELLQDTFTRIWSKGSSFNPEMGRLYTWMMRIARNASLNYIQSKDSRQQEKIRGDDNLVHISDISQGVGHMEAFDLKGAMNQIEYKYQQVVQLIYFQGYTHKEVSDKLNLPLGTVKSRIKIALRELKKIYEFSISSFLLTIVLIFSLA